MIEQGQSLMNPYKRHGLLPHKPMVAAGFCLLKVVVAAAIIQSNTVHYITGYTHTSSLIYSTTVLDDIKQYKF